MHGEGIEQDHVTNHLFFCNTVREKENSQMPSPEVEELHLQPQLFSLQCPSVHLLNEPNTYEKNLKLVLFLMKWILCANILHHVFSVRHIITSHSQPINSAWMAFLSFFFLSLLCIFFFLVVGKIQCVVKAQEKHSALVTSFTIRNDLLASIQDRKWACVFYAKCCRT